MTRNAAFAVLSALAVPIAAAPAAAAAWSPVPPTMIPYINRRTWGITAGLDRPTPPRFAAPAAVAASASASDSDSDSESDSGGTDGDQEAPDPRYGISYIGGDPCGSRYNDDPHDAKVERPGMPDDMKARIEAMAAERTRKGGG